MNENEMAIYWLLCMTGREDEAVAYREKCEVRKQEA